MKRQPLWMRYALSGLLLALVSLGLWLLLAPLSWGGDVAYIILTGNSMSPRFQRGDLVITRRAATYSLGDIVAYRHPRIGYVFHRIVDLDAEGRFILKGDHNHWRDDYHPTQEEIVGRLVLHLPGGGKALLWLRRPWVLALLAAFLVVGMAWREEGRRRSHKSRHVGETTMRMDHWTVWLVGSVGAFLVGIVLAVMAFTRPVAVTVDEVLPYQQEVRFAYTAPALPQVYDAEQVQPGEPVFHQWTDLMQVGAVYHLGAQVPVQQVEGRYRLLAQVRDGKGWQRTVTLVPETTFTEPSFTVQATLDLNTIRHFIRLLEERTGVSRSTYHVVVLLDVQVRALIGPEWVEDHWQPALFFVWDRWELYLTRASTGPAEAPQDPLHPVKEDQLVYSRQVPNVLVLLGQRLPVATARWAAVVLLTVGALGGGGLFWKMRQALETSDPLTRMRLIYGPRLVAAQSLPSRDRPWVEVGDDEALARLAEQNQEMIFYLEEGAWVHFWVPTLTGIYYRTVPRQLVEVAPQPDDEKARWRLWGTRRTHEALGKTLESWARAVGRLYGDEDHSHRVADLAVRLARFLGVRGREITYIYWAALLHDVGLAEVPTEVLRKPGALSAEEKALVRAHVDRLREYLEAVPALTPALRIAEHHHERWDGTGYPQGLQGEDIPLGARILAVVEVFDALTHDRPYRPAWTQEQALTYLEEQAGQAFDRRVVEALIALLHQETPPETPAEEQTPEVQALSVTSSEPMSEKAADQKGAEEVQ